MNFHRGRAGGASLTEILVATAVLAVICTAIAKFMDYSLRGSQQAQVRGELASLRESLRQMVDCDQTFAQGKGGGAVNLASDCMVNGAGAAVPLRLFRKDGTPLTDVPAPGGFSPTDATFNGAAALGDWQLRAYCDSGLGSLVIRVAKRGNQHGFALNPLSKRPLDWSDSPSNPIFGKNASVICGAKFGAVPTPTPQPGCAPGEAITSVNFDTRSFTCKPMAPDVGSTCHWFSHGNLDDDPITQGCIWNVNASDDCYCPAGKTHRGSDLYDCAASPGYKFLRCLCCDF